MNTSPQGYAAAERKIAIAASGRPQKFTDKLRLVIKYIEKEADRLHCSIEDVCCPDRETWSQLSSRRSAALPTEEQMKIYASTDALRGLIAQLGVREAYFNAARHELLGTERSAE